MAPPSTPTATTATTAMAMPSAHAMNGGGGGDRLMGMSAMSMTFFHSADTPLFWDWWTPSGPAQYAATCAFLVALAAVTRILFAVRPVLLYYARVSATGESCSGQHEPFHHQRAGERLLPGDDKAATEAEDGGGGRHNSVGRDARRWWWSGASLGSRLSRACCEVVLVCLGYFLMLAVMTMNAGYFISVLSGVFLGMFLLGNWADGAVADDDRWHQC
ncbi:hypothetical protein N658DRAFT_434686 [Parathielavia hyrcaniae]|uniref:Copper transport protein n=1 Tax=Parathielavia hyrcaniae TaxID=113614 RepID=A0AAN6PSV0_9PEZI|nr:hypothetical protein N658DRAFT_434686 [Parathielavia hyrcaniae]